MTTKTKVIVSIIALVTAYAFGRFSAPEHVKVETKIVEVEKKVEKEKIDKQNHKKTTTVVTVKPDGTKTITKVTTDESETKTNSSSKDIISKTEEKSKEVTNSSSKTTIAALAGANPFHIEKGLDYGAMVSRPVLGPVTVGIFGFKSGTCGVAAGLTF